MKRYLALLLAALVVSCGGGGDGDNVGADSSGRSGSALAGAGVRVEESEAAVSLSGPWTSSPSASGWSGGAAVQSNVPGATVSFGFIGTSVRWIGSRGRGMGIASVRVDGGPATEVDLFGRPADEIRTPVITISGLSNGPHTLTIEVTGRQNGSASGNLVVVDAFDVQPQVTVSRRQDTDPMIMPGSRDVTNPNKYTGGWTKSSLGFPWSGNGVANVPDLPVTAYETQAAGETVTLPFNGTGVSWVGYQGPDAGIAEVRVDGGAPVEVDLYSPTARFQADVFTVSGLADGNHTLTITATGRSNPASSAARVVLDAWDVMTPGRRYEQLDPSITYAGEWHHNDARVWSGGTSRTSNVAGATATFSFTGTSVTWIGCRKSSAGGRARVYIDGVLMQEILLQESYPVEGYQMPVFRADGLAPGPHTLTIEVVSTGPYVVVDAFDVRP